MGKALNFCVMGAMMFGLGPMACADPSPCTDAEPFQTTSLALGQCVLEVELAVSPKQIACGLMHRERLADNAGMIFVLDPDRKISFWMKNTLIPLDIAYLDMSGTILEVNRGVPEDRTWIPAPRGTAYALETNPEKLGACGLGPGANIDLAG